MMVRDLIQTLQKTEVGKGLALMTRSLSLQIDFLQSLLACSLHSLNRECNTGLKHMY
jgi:hypothetical protein